MSKTLIKNMTDLIGSVQQRLVHFEEKISMLKVNNEKNEAKIDAIRKATIF
jgi:hypothetical protein